MKSQCFRGRLAWIARAAGIGCACVALARAGQALDVPAEHHPWGRFQPGSWARTRLTRFEIGADGGEKVEGVTVTTTRLEKVIPEGITLTVETATDGGAPDVQTIEQGWDNLPLAAERTSKLSIGEIKIDGRSFACQTHETTVTGEGGAKTTAKWWYSTDRPPYLLKGLVRTEGSAPHTLSTEVTSLAVEREVLGRKLICFESRQIETGAERASQTTAYGNLEIPGALVASKSETRDKRRGQVEHARLELEAFEAAQ